MEWSGKLCLFLSFELHVRNFHFRENCLAAFGNTDQWIESFSSPKSSRQQSFLANMFFLFVRPLSYDTLTIPLHAIWVGFLSPRPFIMPMFLHFPNNFEPSAKSKLCAKIAWTIKKWHHKRSAVNTNRESEREKKIGAPKKSRGKKFNLLHDTCSITV